MNQWLNLIVYCLIAILGALAHYLKKRYIDNTTTLSLRDYILTNKSASFKALAACVTVAYGYAISTEELFALSTIAGVATGGYVADSGLNKTEE